MLKGEKMDNKKVFVDAINMFKEYRENLYNKSKKLEEIFGADSYIILEDGISQMENYLSMIALLMFPSASKDALIEDLMYYLYEDNPIVTIKVGEENKEYKLETAEAFYDYLKENY